MSDSLNTVKNAVSAGSSLVYFDSPPTYGQPGTLYGGNYVIARVEGQKMVLTSAQLQQYLANGYDVEVLGHQQGW